MEKHCSNCKYSYEAFDFSDKSLGQHCNNDKYNFNEYYTNKELMEDWDKGPYCRFYEKKEETILEVENKKEEK